MRLRTARGVIVEKIGDSPVEGLMDFFPPPSSLGLGEVFVGGHGRSVTDRRNAIRRLERPVRVDHQPAVTLQRERRVEAGGEGSRQQLGTDVVGNVTLHLRSRDAQIAKPRRDRAAGMLTDQDDVGRAAGVEDLARRSLGRGRPLRLHFRFRRSHPRRLLVHLRSASQAKERKFSVST